MSRLICDAHAANTPVDGVLKLPQKFPMHYAYILRSISHPDQRYIGSTSDLRARLAKHNAGHVPHTSKFLPWKVETYIAFETLAKAQAFERYLKSGSGHAFATRHFC